MAGLVLAREGLEVFKGAKLNFIQFVKRFHTKGRVGVFITPNSSSCPASQITKKWNAEK